MFGILNGQGLLWLKRDFWKSHPSQIQTQTARDKCHWKFLSDASKIIEEDKREFDSCLLAPSHAWGDFFDKSEAGNSFKLSWVAILG